MTEPTKPADTSPDEPDELPRDDDASDPEPATEVPPQEPKS